MKRSRLVLSLFVGAISLGVATLSMSVAWYASSRDLRIETIAISVDCDRQLAISTNPLHGYKNGLSNEDLQDVGKFFPVTSSHDEWLNEKSDTPLFYDDTVYTETEDANLSVLATSGFFSQKLYLKADDDVIVTINPRDTYINAYEEVNLQYARELHALDNKYTVNEYLQQLNNLVKAMRFSVLVTDGDDYNYIIIDPNKTDETYFGGILDSNNDEFFDYYNKSSDNSLYERVYGQFNDSSLIAYTDASIDDSDYIDVDEEPNAFNARHKKGVKKFDEQQSLANGLEFKKENSHTLDEFVGQDKPFRFPVYRDKPQEIVLSIYIEGWDRDSVNYTKGATFDSNLSFIIEREQ